MLTLVVCFACSFFPLVCVATAAVCFIDLYHQNKVLQESAKLQLYDSVSLYVIIHLCVYFCNFQKSEKHMRILPKYSTQAFFN